MRVFKDIRGCARTCEAIREDVRVCEDLQKRMSLY